MDGHQVTVSADTPINLAGGIGTDGVALAVLSCDNDLYVGKDDTVTTSTGALLVLPISVDLDAGDSFWVVAGSDSTAHVMRVGEVR